MNTVKRKYVVGGSAYLKPSKEKYCENSYGILYEKNSLRNPVPHIGDRILIFERFLREKKKDVYAMCTYTEEVPYRVVKVVGYTKGESNPLHHNNHVIFEFSYAKNNNVGTFSVPSKEFCLGIKRFISQHEGETDEQFIQRGLTTTNQDAGGKS